MIKYNVISSGSKGNAVIINQNILIDCGVPFKALKDVYKDLRLVLLTHIHGDHFKSSTVKKLVWERPALIFVCRPWMVVPLVKCGVSPYKIDVLFENEEIHYPPELPTIKVFDLVHDVENCGYVIAFQSGDRMIYATDTNWIDHIEAKNFDLYMLEANYSESEITERIRQKQTAGMHVYEWDALRNHLSKEKADDWLYRNMGVNSSYVYLHEHED